MTNLFALLCPPYLSRLLTRDALALASLRPRGDAKGERGLAYSPSDMKASKLIGVLSTTGWLAGLTAILVGCSSPPVSESPTPIPTLTSVSSEEVENYAKAVLAIEQSRQAAYNEIQQINNGTQVADINCTQTKTIASLPSNVQDIAVNYCTQSKKIGESQGLTMSQFNGITLTAQSDPELLKRIQNELLRLQR